MRWSVLLLLLVGCYRVNALDGACQLVCQSDSSCPDGLRCMAGTCRDPASPLCPGDDGMPSDGAIDAPVDATPVPACVTSSFTSANTINGLIGRSYSRTSSDFALYEDGSGNLFEIPIPNGPISGVMFGVISSAPLVKPKLSASDVNGEPQAFFVQAGANSVDLLRSDRVDDGWSNPITIATNLALDATLAIGQPTKTSPRRMMISLADGMHEGIEQADQTWMFGPPFDLGVQNATEPSLSRDGLSLVFVGRDGNGVVRLFLAHRASLASEFESPVALPNNPTGINGTETLPSFDPDCDHIYVGIDGTIVDMF